jgi:lon-related putative ATP-dependent protease
MTEELSADQLRRTCPPDAFDFETTEELPALDHIVGQDRALRAVAFGIDIESPGYHMYALGPVGTGKTTTLRKFLDRKAADRPAPDDWLYVHNFDDPDKPRALRLPAGKGREFRDDMDGLAEDLKTEVPQAFEGEQYEKEREQVQKELQQRQQHVLQELEEKVQARGFGLIRGPQQIVIAPVRDGEVLTPDQVQELDEAEQEKIQEARQELQDELREAMRRVQKLQKEGKEKVRELDRRVVSFAVGHRIDELKDTYAEFDAVLEFLDAARENILKNVETFKQIKQAEGMEPAQRMSLALLHGRPGPSFDQYRVNLIVDHADSDGAPLKLERNPSFPNLVGRVEYQGRFGALVTNFRLIKAGALHQANGGYLMLDVRDLLLRPLAWDVLKRALKNRQIKIESIQETIGTLTTHSLDPEPIPLDIKVVLIGEPLLYYLLHRYDEDFRELFKVKADFGERMDWTDETAAKYAQFIGRICREEDLRHFAPDGVAKVVEHGARMVADRRKLATRFGDVVDLIRQASYWAGTNDHEHVRDEDVRRAIEESIQRSNRIEERLREMIDDGTLLINTDGEAVGQINGISVLPLGDYTFGKPTRITARTHVGTAGVVNIEREAKLGGPLHNKGLMILAGYLGGRYATDVPLALSASLAFEQSYTEVDGDSASSTELYALLSSLAACPVRQDLAVTGSVNQRGQVQAIGGVNEKIEGFFDVCRLRGLTGRQGVLIPAANVKHLMLREDVVDAVRDGAFHVYPVETADEGIARLTGKEAGERGPDGAYPEGSVNAAVEANLKGLAEKVKDFAGPRTPRDTKGTTDD